MQHEWLNGVCVRCRVAKGTNRSEVCAGKPPTPGPNTIYCSPHGPKKGMTK